MREISVDKITEIVAQLCMRANMILPEDIECALIQSKKREKSPVCKQVFDDLIENLAIAKEDELPICQDTGMAVVFVDIGQDVHLTGGLLEDAIEKGIAKGYTEGYLRKSIVKDPLQRANTNDNTPGVIHTRIVAGERIMITVVPKGFGSENMSRLAMLEPSAARNGVVKFVLDTVLHAGSNPCPPIIVGVGIGGDFEYAALLAKRALCRDLSSKNPNLYYAKMEEELEQKINDLGIGSQGFGGVVTTLGVNIETYPTHIAGLPVAVNIGCHVTRHASEVI